MKVLIDTNVFLGLYDSIIEPISIFEELHQVSHSLLLTDQIIDEFTRNREGVLKRLKSKFEKNKVELTCNSSLLRKFDEFVELEEYFSKIGDLKKNIPKKIQRIIDNSENDIIYTEFHKLINKPNLTIKNKNSDIIQKAWERRLSGNPPKSPSSKSIGDEIIWETILSSIDDDLVVVSRDNIYSEYSPFLIKEYLEKTSKSLTICNSISEALKTIDIEPTDAIIKFDQEQTQLWKYAYDFPTNSPLSQYLNVASEFPSYAEQYFVDMEKNRCPNCNIPMGESKFCKNCNYVKPGDECSKD